MRDLGSKICTELELLSGNLGDGIKPYLSQNQFLEINDAVMDRAIEGLRLKRKEEERLKELRLIEKEIFDLDAERFEIALQELKLRDLGNIKSKIRQGDIVEIYGPDYVQIYSNLVFYTYCSYDLGTVVTNDVFTLYSRPQAINEQIVARSQDLMARGTKTWKWNVDRHVLKETKVRSSRYFDIRFKYLASRERPGRESCVCLNEFVYAERVLRDSE